MYREKLLTIFALFIALTHGYSVQQGKRLNAGDISHLEIERLAEPVIQKSGISLKRQDTVGAWSLRAVKCPDTTQVCDMGFPAMEVCCPKSMFCYYSTFRIACCPSDSSCIATASTFPKCGDPSWTLWAGGREDFFCCQPGEIGYITTDNSGACGDPGTIKPTGKQVATSLAQGDGNPPPTSTPNPTSNPSDDNGTTSSSPGPDPSTTVTSMDHSTVTNFPSGTDDDNEPTDTPGGQDQTEDSPDSKQGGNASSGGQGGLSTGVIVGIAVGGILLLVLAVVAVFFALRAGKKRGAQQAMAEFQQQQRSLPGADHRSIDHRHGNPDYYQHSGSGTPGGGSAFANGNQDYYGQGSEVKPQLVPGVAEKYGEGVQKPPAPVSSPPPQQWSPPPPQGDVRYEADATNTYPNTRYAEMEGHNNQQRF